MMMAYELTTFPIQESVQTLHDTKAHAYGGPNKQLIVYENT